MRMDPAYTVSAYATRGRAFALNGDFDRAIADFTTLIDIALAEPRVYADRGRAYADKGEFAGAIADLSTAIRLEGRAADYAARGRAYLNEGELSRAMADYTEAVRRDPTDAGASAILRALGVAF
jgi:tetratricopeptide (TPR) repeat protein